MENITMFPRVIDAALAPATDVVGGVAGVFIAVDRDRGTQEKSAFSPDPRPAGPPV